MDTLLEIDGRYGEGGGQIVRSSLSLSALTQRPFRLTNIRANRKTQGLGAQHLTAVRAVASICQAKLHGDTLGSRFLEFHPQTKPQAGNYLFDVAEARQGGSAGATALVLQAVMWPLFFADGVSTVTIRGGTHVTYSPNFHYLAEVVRPVLARMGAKFDLILNRWGWYPIGQGEIVATIYPVTQLNPTQFAQEEVVIEGVTAVTNLPAHIPHRMVRRADNLLREAGYTTRLTPIREKAISTGAGMVLWVPQAGFTALGRKGLPADKVAETAVEPLLKFLASGAQVDEHLADQLLIPCALAQGTSRYTTETITDHTRTNAYLLSQWLPDVSIEIDEEGKQVTVQGIGS